MPERFLDVSHEALIRGWPRLQAWLDEDRAGLRIQRRITETAEEWQRSDRDNDLLYRGIRLIQAQEWRKRHEVELNPLEREFLDASIVLRQRVEEEKRLHEAESERVKVLVEKRKRWRIFGVTVSVFGVIILIALAALNYVINEKRKLSERTATDLATQRQTLVKNAQTLRENAKGVLLNETSDPIRNVRALRNLATALNLNRNDTEAAKMARDLLLQRVWCPPTASEVRYRQDTFLAAAFAPETNNEIFAVAGDGQLLFWKGRELSSVRSLFEKPKATGFEVVQPGFASFSPNGQWLLIIPPTLASAANADPAPQGPPQRTGGGASAGSAHETCKLQIWRWSIKKGAYESASEDLEFQRLLGSPIINFAWSPESDRVVLINVRGNEAECAFFEVKGNLFQQLLEQSNKLNSMKIVALAFAAYRTGIAVVSMDPTAPEMRKVSFISADDLQVIPGTSLRLSEEFRPNGIAFGPGNDQLTLTSWSGIRILDLQNLIVIPVPPPTSHDNYMRMVVGPGDFATRLVAKSLYGRVEVAKGARMQESAEPVVFGGSIGTAQFSSDGQRLLILSGGIWNMFDRMRLIDVSPLYRTLEVAPKNFEEKPASPWLADIASAVSALDTTGDGSLLTLETVRERYPKSKAGDAYEAVWKRFFPDEKSNAPLKAGR